MTDRTPPARNAGAAKLFGLFVDASRAELEAAMSAVRFDVIQLHGNEDASELVALVQSLGVPVWKPLPATPGVQITGWPAAVLLDTPSGDRGGTGRV